MDRPDLYESSKLNEGWKAFQRGDLKAAALIFKEVVDLSPKKIYGWLGLVESVKDDPELYYSCYAQILKIAPTHKYAQTKLKQLEAQLDTKESRLHLKELQAQINLDPHNGDLYFQQALEWLARCPSIQTIGNDESHLWREDFSLEKRSIKWLALSTNKSDVKIAIEALNTATSLGLQSPLNIIKAAYLCVHLELAKADTQQQPLTENARHFCEFHCREIVKHATRYLRRFPQDILTLSILLDAYNFLGKIQQANDTRLILSRAIELHNKGLINSKQGSPAKQPEATKRNDGIALEEKVQKVLQIMGLEASMTKTTGDGGIDIIAYSEAPIIAGKYIVQCKDWINPVGEPILRDLYGLVIAEGANKGIVITTGRFTSAAERFAKGKPLELIDGSAFQSLLNQNKLL